MQVGQASGPEEGQGAARGLVELLDTPQRPGRSDYLGIFQVAAEHLKGYRSSASFAGPVRWAYSPCLGQGPSYNKPSRGVWLLAPVASSLSASFSPSVAQVRLRLRAKGLRLLERRALQSAWRSWTSRARGPYLRAWRWAAQACRRERREMARGPEMAFSYLFCFGISSRNTHADD